MAFALAVALIVGAGACGSGGSDGSEEGSGPTQSTVVGGPPDTEVPSGSTAPTTPERGLGEGFAPERNGRRALRGFSEVAATITSADGETCEVCLLAATTEDQRQRGLMEVTDLDLGGYDGMLFRFPADQDGAFWMRNTPSPLSIAYFDGSGRYVSSLTMDPCADDPSCVSYPATAPYRYALEVEAGGLEDLGVAEGSRITIDGLRCPRATP